MSERTFEINHHLPDNSNNPVPKEQQLELHQFTLDTEGRTTLTGWCYRGKEFFGMYWPNPSSSPRAFFDSVNRLLDRIDAAGSQPKFDKLNNETFDYWLDSEKEHKTVKSSEFEGMNILEDQTLRHARLNTPYGDFALEKYTPDGTMMAALLTHVYHPNEMAEFISENSSDDLPVDQIKIVLDKVQTARLSQAA